MDAIRTENLTRKFDDLTAVNNLSIDVGQGQIFGLVGPDGAGKTTTMRLLTSILEPTSGKAWIHGYDTTQDPEEIKNHIGYMSQKFGLYHDLTVLENIQFYADIFMIPKKERTEKIEYLLNFSNLSPFKDRLADKLSGGMKQKLGLACALIHQPKILFLDEPTNGVDPVSRRDFWRVLYQLLNQGVTIFLSTAYMDEAERCSRLAFIDGGELLACGTPEQVKQLHKEAIYEVRTANPRESANQLRETFGERHVRLMGNRIHLVTNHPDKVTTILPEAKVHKTEPALEDVFIAISHKKGGANV